ncbi:carboxypeptidase N subunit 2-like [Chironomus tepperi]|uniref:carboxypeptidase N subunit 2-like n=1 Tax=Chironomus tepperi TaxID=113505 RepID=UPI00391F324F
MNIIWLSLLCLTITASPISSISIHCEFEDEDFEHFGEFYSCIIENLVFNSDENSTASFFGEHQNSSLSNDDVKAVKTDIHRMIYFPQSIQNTFKNLEVIYMNDGFLVKITQRDLQPFPKLRMLDLFENRLEVLEQDLFKFNSMLQSVWLSNNRIYEIHPQVFDHLVHLHYLYLSGNACVARTAKQGNRTEVMDLIKEVSAECAPGKFITTSTSATNRFKILNISDAEIKLFETEQELKDFEEEYGGIMMLHTQLINNIEELEDQNNYLTTIKNRLTFCVFFLSVIVAIMAIVIFAGYKKFRDYNIGGIAKVSMSRLI